MKKVIIILCSIILSVSAHSQTDYSDTAIRVRAEIHEGNILLRWVPTNEKAWRLLNKYGVSLERLTIAQDTTIFDEPERVVLAPLLKPTESNRFKSLAAQYPMAAVMAQAIFGKTFEVSMGNKSSISKAIALTEEREQRYIFALYAADLCFPAALEAGWGFEDRSVRSGERYLYRVVSLVPDKELVIESGATFVVPKELTTFPRPLDLSAHFRDASVMLSWNYHTLSYLYPSYMIERSTDGRNFMPISDIPVTRMGDVKDNTSAPITYLDSIFNGTTYYYRVAGITPFGTYGAYSDTISGKAVQPIALAPLITSALPDEHGGATIAWDFHPEDEPLITGFRLMQSSNDKAYTVLVDKLAKTSRSHHIDKLSEEYIYYKVETEGAADENKTSFPVLFQVPDTIPPAVPTGLEATIDSLGTVRLRWNANVDKDIYGYRLYKGNSKEDELVPLNDVAVKETSLTDSVSMTLLNDKVYYALAALDKRYNQSGFSPVVVAQKPEIIRPSIPLITEAKAVPGKNILTWASGGEENLAGYWLYRQEKENDSSVRIAIIENPKETNFTDSIVEAGKTYQYSLIAYTVGKLASTESFPVQITTVSAENKEEAPNKNINFTLKPDKSGVLLLWNIQEKEIASVQLYKKNAENFTLYKDNLPVALKFIDTACLPGFVYEYMLVIKRQGKTPVTISRTIKL